MGDIVSEYTYTLSTNGHQVTTKTRDAAGTLFVETTDVSDLAGRIKSSADEQGMTTTYAYSKNIFTGRSLVTETRPGGTSSGTITVITDTYPEGTSFGVYGTGVEPSVNQYAVATGNGLITTTFRGVSTIPGTTSGYRWHKTTLDLAGRVIQEQTPVQSGNIQKTYVYYNNASTGAGKVQSIDFTGDTVFSKIFYNYDALGNQFRQWHDKNNDSIIGSTEARTETKLSYVDNGIVDLPDVWQETQTEAYDNAASGSSFRVVRKTSSRMKTLSTALSEVHEFDYVGNAGAGVKTVTLIKPINLINKTHEQHRVRYNASSGAPLGTAKEFYLNGLMVASSSETVPELYPTYYTYDSLGRLIKTKAPRPTSGTAVTTITYYLESEKSNAGAYVGREKWITDPLGKITTLTYYRNESWHSSPAGALMTSSNPNAETSHSWYDRWGRVTHQWGTNSYPVKYIYDTSDGTGTFDELEEMQTYRTGSWSGAPILGLPASFGTVGDRTLWTYGGGSGLLTAKGDPNGTTQYNYIAGTGLISTIQRPRATALTFATTTLTYDDLGRVLTRTHNDGTPTVTYTYTRDGRLATASDASGVHTITETATTSTMLRSDVITGTGALNGLTLEDTVGMAAEQTMLTVKQGTPKLTETTYAYDTSKNRLTTATETVASLSGVYAYVAKSDLITTVSLQKSGSTKVTQTRTYNANKERLLSISNSHASGVVTSQGYPDTNHDAADRRKRVENDDGTFWEYVYNARGEVTSSILKHGTTPVTLSGWSYSYVYDNIGNRTSLGGTSGTGSYTLNERNQVTSAIDGNVYVVKGRAPTPATPVIQVDGVGQTVTKQTAGTNDYFKSDVSKSGPDYDTVTVTSGGDSGTWYKFVPPTTDNRTYDYSGNLITDWRWTYTWDAYDRLIKMVTQSSAAIAGVPNYTLDFVYDHLGRRVRKTVKLGAATTLDTKCVYNGWNLVAELNALGTDALVRSYLWGADLSGTVQGAGGVGGLLAIRQVAGTATDQMVCIDGNGNIMALVDAVVSTAAAIKARYTYDAFGQKCRAYGAFTATNPFGFSSKYEDSETGLLYYGHRFYDPAGSRWLSRDPMGEDGGLNLYGFVSNDPVNRWDYLGLLGFDSFGRKLTALCSQRERGRRTTNWVGWNSKFFATFTADSDKYLITRKGGIVDIRHFLTSANVALKNPGFTTTVYVYGGKYRDQDGMMKEYAGQIQVESNQSDVEDMSSNHFGFEFGELVGGGQVHDIKVDVNSCSCTDYKKSVLAGLAALEPLGDRLHDKFLDKYTPRQLPTRPIDIGARAQGGRKGWFVRVALTGRQPGGPNGTVQQYHNDHRPYKQLSIQKAIEAIE